MPGLWTKVDTCGLPQKTSTVPSHKRARFHCSCEYSRGEVALTSDGRKQRVYLSTHRKCARKEAAAADLALFEIVHVRDSDGQIVVGDVQLQSARGRRRRSAPV